MLPPPVPPLPPAVAKRHRLRWFSAGAAAALVIGATGVLVGHAISDDSTGSTITPAPAVAPLGTSSDSTVDVSALVAQTRQGVVTINVVTNTGRAAGTGFVIDAAGLIATNAHVVADAQKLEVVFEDGTKKTGVVKSVDATDDLAVVEVDASGLQALPLGSSDDLRVGQPVVAIGNALGLAGGPTATEGIVSALDRSIDTDNGEHLSHLIQTDAAINPGNSGGPLLTLDGKVVGINSAGASEAQNIGFAIAISKAIPILDQLKTGQSVVRPFLGVSTQVVDSQVADQLGLSVDHGVVVMEVVDGSAAEQAGLRPNDVILTIDGKNIATGDDLGNAIKAAGTGRQIKIGIQRGDQQQTLTATVGSHDA
jgi:S1-C subfamily serine protease